MPNEIDNTIDMSKRSSQFTVKGQWGNQKSLASIKKRKRA